MKKITITLVALSLTLAFLPLQSYAITSPLPAKMAIAEPLTDPEADALVKRLQEIEGMDKSDMSFSEKRALRKEVRSIEKSLKVNNGGVYLSVGGIIIVVLLLILLL